MEQIIQELDRYFQHAKRTKLNTYASAGVMASHAVKAIRALEKLLYHPDYSEDMQLFPELIRELSKAGKIYETYCHSLDRELKGNEQLFLHLRRILYQNLELFLEAFYYENESVYDCNTFQPL
jgi:hypothetical protein